MHIQLQHSFFSPIKSGQERRMHALADNLLRLGNRVSVLVPMSGLDSQRTLKQRGLEFSTHPDLFRDGWKTLLDPCLYSRSLSQFLSRCAPTSRPDVILSFSVPYVVASKRVWPDTPVAYLPGSAIEDWYSQLYGHFQGLKGRAVKIKCLAGRREEHKALRSAGRVFAETEDLRRRLQEIHPKACARYVVLPSPVDGQRFAPSAEYREAVRKEMGIGLSQVVFLCVGRLQWNKNFALALKALAATRTTEFVLLVVGDGPERMNLDAVAAAAGIRDRVMFLGTRSDTERLYAAADIFLHPALVESYGYVVQEAMASGLACVVSPPKYVGISSYLQDGAQAIFADPTNQQSWAGAIDELVQNGAVRGRLGAAARRWVDDRPTWGDLTEVLLRELCEGGNTVPINGSANTRLPVPSIARGPQK